jgi:hypothetical protein
MALPKVATPKYSLKLPSDGRAVNYRPFLVKEEKILLMAVESGNEKELSDAVKTIINNCIESSDSIDVKTLPVFDIEYLFLNLRAKSVGESVKLKLKCKNEKCEHECLVGINLSSVDVTKTEGHDNKIQLTDDIGVIMKYPTFGMLDLPDIKKNPLKVVNMCIDKIYDSKSVHEAKDSTDEELSEFVDSLNHLQFEKIQKFFETMPKMQKTVDFKCDSCLTENSLTVERLQDFFE